MVLSLNPIHVKRSGCEEQVQSRREVSALVRSRSSGKRASRKSCAALLEESMKQAFGDAGTEGNLKRSHWNPAKSGDHFSSE
jgi:hypothetical protein